MTNHPHRSRTVLTFAGQRIPLRAGLSTPDAPVCLGDVRIYDDGQSLITFNRGAARDWYVWSVKRQCRLATYQTRAELEAVWNAAQNSDGPYGLATLNLD